MWLWRRHAYISSELNILLHGDTDAEVRPVSCLTCSCSMNIADALEHFSSRRKFNCCLRLLSVSCRLSVG